jgi:hypothetical protein
MTLPVKCPNLPYVATFVFHALDSEDVFYNGLPLLLVLGKSISDLVWSRDEKKRTGSDAMSKKKS